MKTFFTFFIFTFLLTHSTYGNEKKNDHYKIVDVEVTVDNSNYKALVYVPNETKIKSILILSATIGGVDAVEQLSAQFFSKHGYVVILPLPFLTELSKKNPDTEKLDADYLRPVASTALLISFVENKLSLPKDLPLFAMGASQGGIATLLLSASIPRIKAAWSVVAGGDLPHIYTRSKVAKIEEFRKNHKLTLGISDDSQYENYLRANLKNDPAISCKEIKVPFVQVIALRDESVPTRTQELLVEECPPHKVLRYNYNHTNGVLTTVLLREKIKDFFEAAI